MPLATEIMEARRKELGLSQDEAAKKARLPGKSYWADIISGRRSNVTIDVLDNIAEALNMDPKELLK